MKEITLLGPANGGDQARINALFRVYPFLGKICGKREISVLRILSPEDLPTHPYSVCGMGFNFFGVTFLINEGEISHEISWEDMRSNLRIRESNDLWLNSPQAELTGTEEACVLLQSHSDGEDCWISVEAFICPQGKTFGDFPAAKTWIVELQVRRELKEAGFI